MAYLVVTTDNGTVVFKKHHTEYLDADGHGAAKLLNHFASAVLRSETYLEELQKKHEEQMREFYAAVEDDKREHATDEGKAYHGSG